MPVSNQSELIPNMLLIVALFFFSISAQKGVASEGPGAVVAQGKQLVRQGNLTGARNFLVHAIKEYADVGGLYDLLGVVEAQQGKYSAAEQDFRRAVRLDSKLFGAYLNLGHLYQEQLVTDRNAWANAVSTYEDLLRVSPNNVEGNFQLAQLLERNGNYEASVQHLMRLPMTARHRSGALALLTADYAGLGERSRAATTIEKLVGTGDLSEAEALPVISALESLHERGLELQLLEGLEKRGRLTSPSAIERLGLLYAQQGKLAAARSILEQEAVHNPQPVGTLIELAQIADRQKDYKGALGYLARARDLAPQKASIHFLFGVICVQENLGKEAYKSLKQAVDLKPDNPYYNYAFGAVILNRENPLKAIPYFNKYSQLKPGDVQGKLGVGVAYFYGHDLDSAAKILKSIQSNPQAAATAHFVLGRISELEGNLDQAVHYLELAIKEGPDYAPAFAALGKVRMEQRNYPLAERAFREALNRSPENYLANLNLMILYERTHDARAEAQQKKVAAINKKQDLMARRMLATIRIVR